MPYEEIGMTLHSMMEHSERLAPYSKIAACAVLCLLPSAYCLLAEWRVKIGLGVCA